MVPAWPAPSKLGPAWVPVTTPHALPTFTSPSLYSSYRHALSLLTLSLTSLSLLLSLSSVLFSLCHFFITCDHLHKKATRSTAINHGRVTWLPCRRVRVLHQLSGRCQSRSHAGARCACSESQGWRGSVRAPPAGDAAPLSYRPVHYPGGRQAARRAAERVGVAPVHGHRNFARPFRSPTPTSPPAQVLQRL